MAKKILSIAKKIIWWIFIAMFAFVAVVASWLAIDKFIRKSPVPTFCGYALLTIETGSMSGTIEIGDMILIKDTNDYKIGDIITFLPEGDIIPTTHRIINYGEDGTFVTKGDANNTKDTITVSSDMILGEVINVLPKVGLFSDWVKQEGWLYIVAALVILGVGAFMLKYTDDDTEKNEAGNVQTEVSGDKKEDDGEENIATEKNEMNNVQIEVSDDNDEENHA